MGYIFYSLPVSFQDLAFEIQRTLFRGFDRMELSALCQVDDVLPGAAQDLRRFRCVDDSVGGKVPEISRRQRNTFADPVERRIRNSHVHISRNTVSVNKKNHRHGYRVIGTHGVNLCATKISRKIMLSVELAHFLIYNNS